MTAFVQDTFTEPGVSLGAHTADVGEIWVKVGSGTEDLNLTADGAASWAGSQFSTVRYFNSAVPPSIDYAVKATIGCCGTFSPANTLLAIWARYGMTSITGFRFGYSIFNTGFVCSRHVNNSAVILGSIVTLTPTTANSQHAVRLVCTEAGGGQTRVKAVLDGVTVVDELAATLPTGRAGIQRGGFSGASLYLDNFIASVVSAGGTPEAPTVTPILYHRHQQRIW